MARPDFSLELACDGIVAGVDEAGRGPWAGPVVAAAVILDPTKKTPKGIDDSKKLSRDEREALYTKICAVSVYGVGIATVAEIDTMNILEATKLAMRRAVEQLSITPEHVLIDGNRAPLLTYKVQTVVGGDAKSLSIAAASIIAKVTRDRIMQELAIEFPGYAWERNAGYGTSFHQSALAAHGITPHHRRSFAPIRSMLEATELFGNSGFSVVHELDEEAIVA